MAEANNRDRSLSPLYNYFNYQRSDSTSSSEAETLDFSYMDLEECETNLMVAIEKHYAFDIFHLLLNNNLLNRLPGQLIVAFKNLETLDISSNHIAMLPKEICELKCLRKLIVKNNLLDDFSLPKEFSQSLTRLQLIDLGGNCLTQFPYQLLEMSSLVEIGLGGNKLTSLPRNYENLTNLQILYLGGNQISVVPEELSQLVNLRSLNLSDNRIQRLPSSLAKIRRLRNLSLHNNHLTTLPVELVKLNLAEISLRNNPLVSRFIRELNYDVPTLLELCGRIVKSKEVPYNRDQLPATLVGYLDSANCCLNPKCRGVYFSSKIEHIKFVDFCGKYRVPFMQYLCSPKCNQRVTDYVSSESELEDEKKVDNSKLKKVLLG